MLSHYTYRWTSRTNIATEYGVYCSNAYLAALSISYYFVGYAVGTTTLGVLADRFCSAQTLLLVLASLDRTQFLVPGI